MTTVQADQIPKPVLKDETVRLHDSFAIPIMEMGGGPL
jgi:hypothetical protein